MAIPHASITLNKDAVIFYPSNQTTTAFTEPMTWLTSEPSGDGYFWKGDGNNIRIQNHLTIGFFGTDANNETFQARIYGVKKVSDSMWARIPRGTIDVTLSDMVGLSGQTPSDSDFIADTATADDSGITSHNGIITVDMIGYSDCFIEFDIDALTGPAASANAFAWTI